MSALALVMNDHGFKISGSDQKFSTKLKALHAKNIKIFSSQTGENIKSLLKENNQNLLIVISSAIKANNEELIEARKSNLKILHRADLLADLIKNHKNSIAVAGSHGKTTTSTFLSTLLSLTGKDPTAIIGGEVPFYQSNAYTGNSNLLVAEADESDGSLVKFKPSLGIINNIEHEHADHYKTLKELIHTIKLFKKECSQTLANFDCPNIRNNIKPDYWWSTKEQKKVDFAGIPISIQGHQIIANYYEKNIFLDKIIIPFPGTHDCSNMIAAIAACRIQGVPFKEIKNNLSNLKKPKRRFEFKGTWKDRLFVDDYAHHPTEIKATINMANEIIKSKESNFPNNPKRLFIIFQPHRYSRTKMFLQKFAESLNNVDMLILAPTYSAGEKYIEGANIHSIKNEIKKLNPNQKIFIAKGIDDALLIVKQSSKPQDLILTMGAGDINNLWKLLNNEKENKTCQSTIKAA